MDTKVYVALAQSVMAYNTCIKRGADSAGWARKHAERIKDIVDNHLPHGSGFDCGCTLDLDKSSEDKLVIHTSFHHMNDGGMYDGWTEHTVTVRPSLAFGFQTTISGSGRNSIKDYIGESFQYDLDQVTTR